LITHDRLRELLAYNTRTGVFVWLKRPNERSRDLAGKIAGATWKSGRRVIKIDGKQYYAAQLAWFYVTERWPDRTIDHEDRNPGNDKWNNLRLANDQQQIWNRKCKVGKSGHTGVRQTPGCSSWQAIVRVNGKKQVLGTFKTTQEAAFAYDKKVRETRGAFGITNFSYD
jgi:hypothetical protein